MQISSAIRILRLSAAPLLFSAATLSLLTVQTTLRERTEQAKARAMEAARSPDASFAVKIVGLRFRELVAAAEKGDLQARIEIGRRLASGSGVKKDEGRAAVWFQKVIDEFGEIGPRDKRGPLISEAYRQLAELYKRGAAAANIMANPAYAFSLVHHAASYFGDPAAQVELAKLFIKGEGVPKNSRAAAQWLLSASRKGYAPAQALLGELLWRGDGVKRAAGEGLGLLAIAKRNASPEDKAWVSKMFEAARAQALPVEILEANAFIVQEMSASRFGAAAPHGGGDADAPVFSQIGTAAPAPSAQKEAQAPIIHGAPEVLPGLMGNPMALAPGALEPALPQQGDEAKEAGFVRIYQPQKIRLESENNTSPVRYAGVSD